MDAVSCSGKSTGNNYMSFGADLTYGCSSSLRTLERMEGHPQAMRGSNEMQQAPQTEDCRSPQWSLVTSFHCISGDLDTLIHVVGSASLPL